METITRFLLDLERSVIIRKKEKSLLMKTKNEVFKWSLQTITCCAQITDRSGRRIPSVFFGLALNIRKADLRSSNREVSYLVPFILQLRVAESRKVKQCRNRELADLIGGCVQL